MFNNTQNQEQLFRVDTAVDVNFVGGKWEAGNIGGFVNILNLGIVTNVAMSIA